MYAEVFKLTDNYCDHNPTKVVSFLIKRRVNKLNRDLQVHTLRNLEFMNE